MHPNNIQWLKDLKQAYPGSFSNVKVLELGSGGTEPVIRNMFDDSEYYGIDIASGPNVTIVQKAKDTQFMPGYFDVLVCFSMLEHDPEWQESIAHNIQWLKKGALIIGCHGAEGNLHHGPEPWKIVPEQDFLDHIATLPVDVVESFFEEDRYGPDCAGAYDWIIIKRG